MKYLSLQSIDNIKRSNSLSLCMFRIGNRIANDSFKEDFENATGLFVDKTWNTFDATTTRETANSGFCNSLWSLGQIQGSQVVICWGNLRMLSRRILRWRFAPPFPSPLPPFPRPTLSLAHVLVEKVKMSLQRDVIRDGCIPDMMMLFLDQTPPWWHTKGRAENVGR